MRCAGNSGGGQHPAKGVLTAPVSAGTTQQQMLSSEPFEPCQTHRGSVHCCGPAESLFLTMPIKVECLPWQPLSNHTPTGCATKHASRGFGSIASSVCFALLYRCPCAPGVQQFRLGPVGCRLCVGSVGRMAVLSVHHTQPAHVSQFSRCTQSGVAFCRWYKVHA
jgi:hypothetical protein